MRRMALVVCVTLLVVACASSGGVTRADSTATAASRPPRRNPAVITSREVEEITARDAYHAVQLLRPDWLRSRGMGSVRDAAPLQVVVYVDGQRFGDARSLEQFRAGSFKELRYYSGTEATNRWGTGHGGGVIYLSSR